MTRTLLAALVAVVVAGCDAHPTPHTRPAIATVIVDALANSDGAGWTDELDRARNPALLAAVGGALSKPITTKALDRGITVRHVHGSRLVELSVRLDDPALALEACDRLVRGYVDAHRHGDARVLDGCAPAR